MERTDAERWQRARELFEASLDLPATARQAWLRRQSDGDAELLAELEALLAADARSVAELEPPTLGTLAARGGLRPGERLGAYVLEEQIGDGGMGSVWRAARADGAFERKIAIKVCKRGLDTDAVLRRFELERQVLADLDHPGIARLLDGGATASGLPFLVMEFVRGDPIDRHCDARRLPLRDRIELFIRVCDAVQHAHHCRVVHRDLKPGNLLVTADGRPKLLDFGIAKILRSGTEGGSPGQTVPGQQPMTPEYASPEQLTGEAVTPATDVFGLGLVLFELLTGRRALARQPVAGGPAVPRPSTVVRRDDPPGSAAALAAARQLQPRQLRAALEGDLDAIVSQALEAEADRRYADAGALRDDLERHLRGLPVRARRDGMVYRARRFVRRHRVGVGVAALVLLLLAAATTVSTLLYLQADRARRRADYNGYVARIGVALAALEGGDVVRARRALGPSTDDVRWEFRHALARLDHSDRCFADFTDDPTGMAAAPGAGLLLVGTQGGRVILFDLEELRPLHEFGGPETVVLHLALSGDGRHGAFVREDHGFAGVDTEARTEAWSWEVPGRGPLSLAVDRDFGLAACGYRDGGVELRAIPSGEVLLAWQAADSDIQALAFAPDGGVLASGTVDAVKLWDPARGALLSSAIGCGPVWRLGFAADSRRLAVAQKDGEVAIVDVVDGALTKACADRSWRAGSAVFSPRGDEVLVASYDQTIHVVPLSAGGHVRRLLGHTRQVEAACYDPPRGRIVSIGRDRTLRAWSSGCDDVVRWSAPAGWYMGLAVTPTVDLVAVSGGWPRLGPPRLSVLEAEGGRERWSVPAHEGPVTALAAAAHERLLATGSEDGEWKLWEAETGRCVLAVAGHSAAVLGVAFAPRGDLLATASRDGTAALWRLADGGLVWRLTGHDRDLASVAFSADGERLLTASWDGTARVWSSSTRAQLMVLRGHSDLVWEAVYSPDGRRVATASWDGTARLWDADDGRELACLRGHSGRVYGAAFSPDGTRLATAGDDRIVHLWDLDTGVEVAALSGHRARVDKVAFTGDGEHLLSLSVDGELRRWDAPAPGGR